MKLSKYIGNKKIVSALVFTAVVAGIGAYQVFVSRALSQSTNKSSFDYGQISGGGGWSQPAGGIFSGAVVGSFDFNNASPQQMVYQIGYDSTRVEVLSVTCKTSWGCYESKMGDGYFGLHRPSVLVCIDVPNGKFPDKNVMFSIQFKTRVALSSVSNWWSSSSGVAPGTCTDNITADGFMFNTIDGSGACGGQFEECDRGPSPAISSYIGFGPPSTAPADASAPTPVPAPSSRGGSGGSIAKKQSSDPSTIPSTTAQGTDTKQPDLIPSPFFDGKEYASGSDPDTLGSTAFSVGNSRVAYAWVYLAVALAVITGGAVYWQRFKRKQ